MKKTIGNKYTIILKNKDVKIKYTQKLIMVNNFIIKIKNTNKYKII